MKVQIKRCFSYMRIASFGLSEQLQFTAEFILSFFIIAIQAIVYVFIFDALLQGSSVVQANEITGYYIVVNILGLSMIPAQYVAWQHQEDINNGMMILNLTRPNNYLLYNYLKYLLPFLLRLIVNFVFIMVTSMLLHLHITPLHCIIGFFSAIGGFTILFLLQAIVGCQTVWLHDITRLRDVMFTSLLILGGRLLPSRYLFSWLKEVVYFTPLPYVYDIPTEILTGDNMFQLLLGVGGQMLWIVLLGMIYVFYFNKRVRHNLEYGV